MVGRTVAVIGAGSIGTRHAGNLDRLGVSAELIPWRAFDARAFAARKDIAAMVIATATPIRLELIQLCAQMNIPFYAEKPLAWTVAQAEAIHAAARPVAKRSMVGFMMRYHPAVLALAERDLSGVYGFSMEIGHDVRQWRQNWRFADSYAARAEGGGVLLDLCHELDMALALFPGLQLHAADCLGHAGFPGVDFASFLQLAVPGGPVGRVAMDYLAPVSTRRASFRGMADQIEVDFLIPEIVTAAPGGSKRQAFDFDRNDMFLNAMRDFLALVEGGAVSGNPLLPRFDLMEPSSRLIAAACEAKRFTGQVTMQMD